MNELLYSFMNQIEDPNKIKDMTVEEFSNLVKSNKLIAEDDAKQLIESFKKISSKKNITEEDTEDSDQRKKKYRDQHKQYNREVVENKDIKIKEKENEDNSLER